MLLQDHYPRFRGAPIGRLRTLTRHPPSVDSGLDGDAFKDMLIDSDFLMGEELARAQLAGWMSSPEDIASDYKQRILDEGQVPKEVMQKLYEQVEDYKAKRG